MAYLDDNNDNLYTQGDPLDALDKELAELKAALGTLDEQPAPLSAQRLGEEPRHISASPSVIQEDTNPTPEKQQDEETMDRSYNKKPVRSVDKPAHRNSKKRIPLIIIAIVLSVAIVLGIGYAVMRLVLPGESGAVTPTAGGEMVTINDSVMGDIELQTVKGAEINTYTAENLQYDDNGYPVYYEDGKKISHLGIDLSEYQGEVDFAAAKAAGVEFVMLRLGGRYYGEDGGLYEDSAFDTYYEQAKAAGIKVGAYFFSQAASIEDATEESNYTLSKLNNRTLDYPIAFDWENIEDDEARTDNVTGSELTTIAEAFCDTVTAAGYQAIVYSNTQQMFVMYDFETMKDYDFWLADYRDFPTMYYKFDMWQYAMDGSIDGIDGAVDLNLSFTDFS